MAGTFPSRVKLLLLNKQLVPKSAFKQCGGEAVSRTSEDRCQEGDQADK